MKTCKVCLSTKGRNLFYPKGERVQSYCLECGLKYTNRELKELLAGARKNAISSIANLEGEEWRVVEWSDIHKISNYGRVQGPFGLNATKKPDNTGYLSAWIGEKRVTIHHMVAVHFLSHKPEKGLCINHIDGNKLNNHSSNLEIVTLAENNKHAREVLGHKLPTNRKTPQELIDRLSRELAETRKSIKQLARENGLNHQTARYWLSGARKEAKNERA